MARVQQIRDSVGRSEAPEMISPCRPIAAVLSFSVRQTVKACRILPPEAPLDIRGRIQLEHFADRLRFSGPVSLRRRQRFRCALVPSIGWYIEKFECICQCKFHGDIAKVHTRRAMELVRCEPVLEV